MKHLNRTLRASLAASVAGFALSIVAHAQTASETGDSLANTLNAFAATTDLEILFEPDMVSGVKSNSVQLSGSSIERLELILAGTGLQANEAAPGVFVIVEETQTPADPDPRPRAPAPDQQSPASAPSETRPANVPTNEADPAGFIRGQIVDDGSGKGLAGSIVTLIETGQTATTNARGEFRFGAVVPGVYEMKIDYLGLGTTTETVTVESRETTNVEISLPYFMDRIVVESNRSSLSQALNQQRAAPNSSTIVAADLLGSFPAENVSEALRRVSGVAFERDDITGEGQNVTVRGINSDGINIKLNGIQLNGVGVDRSIDLSGVQGDNISQITIHKTLLPSQEANGTGGLVEIETKSGLDYGDRYLTMSLEGETGEESAYGDEFQINATGAYKFTDKFGVAGTLQYRETERSNLSAIVQYLTIPIRPEGITLNSQIPAEQNFPFDPEVPNPLQVGNNYLFRARDESLLTGSLNFAWDVADHTTLRLDLQRSESEQFIEEQSSTQRAISSSLDIPVPQLGGEVRRRSYITTYAPSYSISESDIEQTTDVISLRGDTNLGQWDFEYKVGFSETVRTTRRDSVLFFNDNNLDELSVFDPNTIEIVIDDDPTGTPRVVNGVAGFTADNVPIINFSEAGLAYAFDPDEVYINSASRTFNETPTEEWTSEFSSRYNFTRSFVDYVEGGIKYTANERNNSDDRLSNTSLSNLQSYSRTSFAAANRVYISSLGQDLSPFNLGQFGAGAFDIPVIAAGSASNYINQIDALTVDDPNTAENEQRFRLNDLRGEDPIENAGAPSRLIVTEDRLGLYVQAGATIGKFDITAGGRYEALDSNGNSIAAPSINLSDGTRVSREQLNDVGLVRFFDSGSSTENFTPSILANYRPNENVVVRLGWFRSTVNPTVAQIARPFVIRVDARTTGGTANTAAIREANPDLQSSVTDNFDLDFSYFFRDNPGLIRLGLFYKNTESNFTNEIVADVETSQGVEERILEELAPLLDRNPGLFEFNDETVFFLQRPTNGDGGSIYGVEFEVIRQLDFLPETWPSFLENFSFLANVTWTDADFPTDITFFNGITRRSEISTEDLPLEGTTEWSGTTSIAYEQGGFSGRLIYTGQSAAVTNYNIYNINRINPDFDTLDLRLQYTFESAIGKTTLFFEGDNLLAGPKTADVRSENGSFGRDQGQDFAYPTSIQFNGGRTFTLGGRVTF